MPWTRAECHSALVFPMRIWGEKKLVASLLLLGVEGSFLRQVVAQALPLAFGPLCWFSWQMQSDGQAE